MQDKMIEIRGKNDKWLMINSRDIKCVTFDRQANDRERFKITIVYYGDEGELELNGLFTEDECVAVEAALGDEEVDKLRKLLLLIGEKAMLDFDDVVVGQVDKAVKDRHKYKDWLVSILKR